LNRYWAIRNFSLKKVFGPSDAAVCRTADVKVESFCADARNLRLNGNQVGLFVDVSLFWGLDGNGLGNGAKREKRNDREEAEELFF
jgi:hypothetical protein